MPSFPEARDVLLTHRTDDTKRQGNRPVVGFPASGGRPPPRRRGGDRRCVGIVADWYHEAACAGVRWPEAVPSNGVLDGFDADLGAGRPEEFAAPVTAIIADPMLDGAVTRLDGALRMQAR